MGVTVSDEMVRVAHAEYHKVLGDAKRSDPMRAALEAALGVMEPMPWPDTEPGVDVILARYRKFITARPELLSLLYDIDMLPEQTVTYAGAVRLAGLCEVWKKGEAHELPTRPSGEAKSP